MRLKLLLVIFLFCVPDLFSYAQNAGISYNGTSTYTAHPTAAIDYTYRDASDNHPQSTADNTQPIVLTTLPGDYFFNTVTGNGPYNSLSELKYNIQGVTSFTITATTTQNGFWGPKAAAVSIFRNGLFLQRMQIGGDNDPSNLTINIDNNTSAEEIEIVVSSDQLATDNVTILGTVVNQVSANAGAIFTKVPVTKKNNVILSFGDSIFQGLDATNPETDAVAIQLRANNPDYDVYTVGYGGMISYWQFSNQNSLNALIAQFHVALDNVSGVKKIVMNPGVNDFGNNSCTATQYATAYANALDQIHAAFPTTTIYVVTPIYRLNENTPNNGGFLLQDFRDAMASVYVPRSAYLQILDGKPMVDNANTVDGTHPNTVGYMQFYNALAPKMMLTQLPIPAMSISSITNTGFNINITPVTNATSYTVYINNQTYTTSSAAKVVVTGLNVSTTYGLKVVANGTGYNSSVPAMSMVTTTATATTGLDKTGVNQIPSGAYSLRQLKTNYAHSAITAPAAVTGFSNSGTPLIRVRRSSDDNQLDIGYTTNGDLDTLTLKSFTGSGNAYITTWYDQSSDNYDVAQPNKSQQPVIVTAGVVERSGAMPAIRFINAAQTVLWVNEPASTMFGSGYVGSVFPVMEASGASVKSSAFGYGSGNDRWQVHAIQGANFDVGSPFARIYVANDGYTGIIKNYSFMADANFQQLYIGGILQASATGNMTPCNQTQFNIGGVPDLFCYHDNHESELIIYNNQLNTTDRQTMESNQMDYYTITNAPRIASFSPAGATTGTAVTITGINFTNVNAVSFGGTAASSFTVNSSSSITAVVGAGASGSVSVTTSMGTASLASFSFKSNLDKIGISQTASSAYSLRQLKTAYSHTAITAPATVAGFSNSNTPVVRVRRSSDNNQLDIGYTASGDLDTVTLKSFVGNGNGYVTTWYDQSSNSYDVVQPTPENQPVLVTAGVMERSGIMPAVLFINAAHTVLQNNIPAGTMLGSGYIGSAFPVMESDVASAKSSAFGYGSGNDRWQVHAIQGVIFDVGNSFNRIVASNNSYIGTIKNYSLIADNNMQQIYVGGILQASSATAMTACTQTQFNIGGLPDLFCYHDKHESELIIYNTQLPIADRQTLEVNQGTYYAVLTAPGIASFTPASGSSGTVVTITGTNLTGATAVNLGNAAATSFTVNSATSITAVVGAGASGMITVTTGKGTASLGDFSYGSGLEKIGINQSARSAYSLRQLKTTYTHSAVVAPATVTGFTNSATPVIRVRRSSDNAQLDIGYTVTGDLDTNTLKNFVGINNGYVTTWYDQSSNSYDVTQSSIYQQPFMVTNGVVERSGAMPAIRFNNAAQTVLQNNIPASAMFGSGYIASVFPVMEASGATVKSSAFGYGSGNDRWQVHAIQGANFDVGNPFNRIYVTNDAYTNVLKNYSLIADANLQQIYVNGAIQASSTTAMTPCNQTQFNIGGIPNFFCYHDNHESELIIYNIQLSATDRQTMEGNQHAYYNPQSQSNNSASAFTVNMTQPNMAASASEVKLNFNAIGGEGTSNYQLQKLGASGFSSIANLTGTGTGDFTTIDTDPLNGYNYYRIAATDSKGKLVYSSTVNLNVLSGGKGIQVYPNPVSNSNMVLNFNLMNKGTYNLTLVDAVGNVMLKKAISYDGYSTSVTVPAPNTKIGVYILYISSDAYQRTFRLIFQ